MIKQLQKSYYAVVEIQREIENIEKSIKNIKSLDTKPQKQNTFLSLINTLEKVKKKYQEKKSIYEDIFCKTIFTFYRIKCIWKEGKIECDEIFADSKIKQYQKTLKEYEIIFTNIGFEKEEDFRIIISNYTDICTEITLLETLVRTLEENPAFLEGLQKDIILIKWKEYLTCKKLYEELLEKIKKEGKNSLSRENLNYILENTSIIHLVYTNNKSVNPLSKIDHSFFYQFDKENKSPIYLSIETNHFYNFRKEDIGNQIDYLMEIEKLTYEESALLLAEVYEMEIPNNIMREEKYNELVNKYKSVLMSNEYKMFLIQSYARENVEKRKNIGMLYRRLLEQIDRVQKGRKDPFFIYKLKQKKYKYSIVENKKNSF